MPSPSSVASTSFASPSPGILTRSATGAGPSTSSSSPLVVSANSNRMAASYSYGGSGNNNSSWFSGLKAKLSGMSEWLSQLGISSSQQEQSNNDRTIRRGEKEMTPSSASTSAEPGPGEGYDDGTGFSFQSIRLDDCASADINPLGWMDLDSEQTWGDTLERQHFGPLRDLLTIGGSRRGGGHEFKIIPLLHPTWCDKCGDFIWGFMQQATKCSSCNYTCHERCRPLVSLDCRSLSNSQSSEDEFDPLFPHLDGTLGTIPQAARLAMRSNASTESAPLPDCPPLTPTGGSREGTDKENSRHSKINPLFNIKSPSATVPRSFAPHTVQPKARTEREPSAPPLEENLDIKEVYVKEDTPCEWAPGYKDAELTRKIDHYNKHVDQGLGMQLNDDGSFSGFLHIHMNFTRPINIVAGERPPTVYDVVNTAKSTASLRTITSFFLPRNTVKTVALNSEMTTRQMIVTLLRKFKVADNPRKFALYECTQSIECHTLMRKFVRIADDVCPLRAALHWESPREKAFVLQENDTGDILWDAFESPELENFLRILKMEEEQYRQQISLKYKQYEYYLDAELNCRDDLDTAPFEYAPAPPPLARDYDGFSTSSSVMQGGGAYEDDFGTMRPATFHTAKSAVDDEPMYVNIGEMGQSTRL